MFHIDDNQCSDRSLGAMMAEIWRLALSLDHLRSQINAKWPDRSKDSDGSIGDARHQKESSSDHNPWITDSPGPNVVSAIDITHDPAHGFDSYKFADILLHNQDPRLKYVISNRRIGSGPNGPSPGVWRQYTGSIPHDHHVHISVVRKKDGFDNVSDWKIDDITTVVKPTVPMPTPVKIVPRPVTPKPQPVDAVDKQLKDLEPK